MKVAMKESELLAMGNAMTQVEEAYIAKLKTEADIFSKIDEKAKREEEFIEEYLQKLRDRMDIRKALKTKLGLKKVEGLFGDVAVVSDEHYKMGVVNLNGEVIVPFGKYGWIGSYREDGTAPVRDGKRFWGRKDAKWGVINRYGEEVEPLE